MGKNTFSELAQDAEPTLPELDTESNRRVRNTIDSLRREKGGAYQQVRVIPAGHALEKQIIGDMLTEDCKNPRRDFSYLQFLSHVHKLILGRCSAI